MPKRPLSQPDLDVFPDGRAPKRGPSSRRGRAFVRLWVELQRLQSSRAGVTFEQLAAETGVSTRTIRRDLEVFHEANVPLVDERDEETGARRWRAFDRAEVA